MRVVVRRGDVIHDLRLTRATVTSDDVVVEHLRGDISRVQVRAFTRGVGREVRDALAAAGDRRIPVASCSICATTLAAC